MIEGSNFKLLWNWDQIEQVKHGISSVLRMNILGMPMNTCTFRFVWDCKPLVRIYNGPS